MLKLNNFILFVGLFILPAYAQSDINTGISFGSEGLKSFYFSISQYYNVPEKQVILVRDRRIPEEELPVVFFIADRAKVAPEVIVDLRIGGSSWYDISVRHGIYPDVYYVPLEVDPGPPYGKAYGYYKNKPRKEWRTIWLSDNDIVNLVNLNFISGHYSYDPEKVVKMRSEGKNYIVINDYVKSDKGNKNKSSGKKKDK